MDEEREVPIKDADVSPWARNAVYVFRQGGPTLVALLCMGLVAWQAMSQVTEAVNALTLSVERNAATTMKFMETVQIDHRGQFDMLRNISIHVSPK